MNIQKIRLKNYRCFTDLEIELHDKLTVFVGNNGSGKTSVLEGLAISLGSVFTKLDGLKGGSINKNDVRLKAYPMGESNDIQPQYPVEISAHGIIDGLSIKWKRTLNREKGSTTIKDAKPILEIAEKYQSRLRAGDQSLILPFIAYYGTGRLWDYHREKKSDVFRTHSRTNGYIDSLSGTANIKLMMNWFRMMSFEKMKNNMLNKPSSVELDMVYYAMKQCFSRITGYTNVELLYNMFTNEIDCYYVDEQSLQKSISLSRMSDGYKGTLSLIADIAYRIAVLNPQLGTNGLQETSGVVLIDEVDLHLHPAWQHRILSDLCDIFPKIQFVVTTHAPAVISSVRSENLAILKNDEVIDPFSEIYGNDANSILKEIMGVAERNPTIAAKFEQFNRLLNDGLLDEAETVLDEIDRQREYHDKEVAADRVKLKLERIRRRGK